jgi:6-pyruvoyltetrahydropterin/6-carboxytetrahydropterin synthase
MFTIGKQFSFSASHQLQGLSKDHPCSRLHGHNYTVEVELSATLLSETGFVVDYSDLKKFEQILDGQLDHRHLNEVLPFQPSAENIALYLFERAKEIWPNVTAVKVRETPRTWAEYRDRC